MFIFESDRARTCSSAFLQHFDASQLCASPSPSPPLGQDRMQSSPLR